MCWGSGMVMSCHLENRSSVAASEVKTEAISVVLANKTWRQKAGSGGAC